MTLGGTASDAGSGIGQMVFKVNGAVVGTTTGSPASVNWDSTSTPDGPVSVTVEAKDVAGNGPTVSSARTIVVDNHPPTVTLANPGAAVRGTVSLTTTTSADTTQVTFERSPAGAGTWTTIAVDNTPAVHGEPRHDAARGRPLRPARDRDRRRERRHLERRHDARRQHRADRLGDGACRRRHRRRLERDAQGDRSRRRLRCRNGAVPRRRHAQSGRSRRRRGRSPGIRPRHRAARTPSTRSSPTLQATRSRRPACPSRSTRRRRA